MKLRDDWRLILRRAWSVRLMILAAVLSGLEVALPLLDGFARLPRGVLAVLSFAVTAGALVARIVAQRNMQAENDSAD